MLRKLPLPHHIISLKKERSKILSALASIEERVG